MDLENMIEPDAATLFRMYNENDRVGPAVKVTPHEAHLIAMYTSTAISMKRIADAAAQWSQHEFIGQQLRNTSSVEAQIQKDLEEGLDELNVERAKRNFPDNPKAAYRRAFGSGPQEKPSFWRRLWANLHGRPA